MIYLAKSGKIFGPFNDRDFAMLSQSSGLEEYRWIWKDSEPGWKPLDAMPTTAPNVGQSPLASVSSEESYLEYPAYVRIGDKLMAVKFEDVTSSSARIVFHELESRSKKPGVDGQRSTIYFLDNKSNESFAGKIRFDRFERTLDKKNQAPVWSAWVTHELFVIQNSVDPVGRQLNGVAHSAPKQRLA